MTGAIITHTEASCWQTTAALKTLSLWVHNELKVIYCAEHQYCVQHKHLMIHFQKYHNFQKDANLPFINSQIALLGIQDMASQEFVQSQSLALQVFYESATPLPLLPIEYYNAVKCNMCEAAYFKDARSSRNHFSNHHHGATVSISAPIYTVQSLFQGKGRHLFKVGTSEPNISDEMGEGTLQSLLQKAMAPRNTISTEESINNSFEQHHHWIATIDSYGGLEKTAELCSEQPQNEIETRLLEALIPLTKMFVTHVNDVLIRNCTMYLLRKITDIEEQNTSTGTGFSSLQRHTSKEAYAMTLTKFIMYLYRSCTQIQYEAYSQDVSQFQEGIRTFFDDVMQASDDELNNIKHVEDILLKLLIPVFCQIQPANAPKSSFVAAQFIMFANALSSGSLQECHRATQVVAHVQYLMRACVLASICR